ncbi:MAG: hypothetical protein LUB83_02720 [Prevotellaceae bacterium]|nr:hypothetical protein [Prevotellaceae bacterium]
MQCGISCLQMICRYYGIYDKIIFSIFILGGIIYGIWGNVFFA